jgi:penicillin-binding protein 1B
VAKPRAKGRRRRWLWYLAVGLAGPVGLMLGVMVYYYVTFSRLIDARLHGERTRTFPRIFARPFQLAPGQSLTDRQLIDRLNDLGYAQAPRAEAPGQFAVGQNAVALMIRGGKTEGDVVRVVFGPAAAKPNSPATSSVKRLEPLTGKPLASVTLEAPLLTALIPEARAKRRNVPLGQIPVRMRQAVLAIEDRRFYDHPGVDPIRSLGAVVTNLRGDKPYLVGGSTLTQQLTKNLMLTPEKSMRRKLTEQFMSLIVEQRLSKDEILELYLNEVYLGQRGSFAVHGVAEGARLFFGKDVVNLTLAEAATLAGIIQSPQVYSPFRSIDRCTERRNVVLGAMRDTGYITREDADRASHEPLTPVARALESEAPYFVDFVEQDLAARSIDVRRTSADVYTTLDLHLQRLAQDTLRTGLLKVDEVLSRRRRKTGPAQAALLAIDPRTGDILAMVGGRSYNQSQYNRVMSARRQPGSVFKPFVYLAAFEQARADGRVDLTPATVVTDEPTTFFYEDKDYQPGNYDDEYDGPITLRRALARSRNVAAVKVAEAAGYEHVAELWRRVGIGTPPLPYPSIALGVFEATPFEIATAYTIFPNGGEVRPLRAVTRLQVDGRSLQPAALGKSRHVAERETTFLVTNMMRSVVNEGTGASARAAGFLLDAAGKSGTTNELRDAWFVGFTPELLTVVWVGLDDNRPLGMSGTQAALPIWTNFMVRALAGHASQSFSVPEQVIFAEIDPDTGYLASPSCPRTLNESFMPGTSPTQICLLHGF